MDVFKNRCIQFYLNVQVQLSFCTYFLLYPLVITLQDWSVNYVRKLKCQPCMEAAQLGIDTYPELNKKQQGFSNHYNQILHQGMKK